MGITPEGQLKRQLLRLVGALGGYAFKTEFKGRAGCPDWLICLPSQGRFAFIELKSPDGKLSAFQVRIIDIMKQAHIPVYVCRNEGEIKKACGL